MLTHNPWYFGTVRSYTANFGDLFNNIRVRKFDSSGAVTKTIKVPISFSAKEKWYRREVEEYGVDGTPTMVKQTVPRIGFNLNSFSYDPSRKTNRNNKFFAIAEGGKKGYQLGAAPYNFEYGLYIAAGSIDELLQILEQILPYFQPDYTMKVRDNPGRPQEYSDVSVSLNSVAPTIQYDGDLQERRLITCELSFQVKGNIYSPVIYPQGGGEDSGLIKHTLVNIYPQNTPEIISSENKAPIEIHQSYVDPFEADKTDEHEVVENWYGFGEEPIDPRD